MAVDRMVRGASNDVRPTPFDIVVSILKWDEAQQKVSRAIRVNMPRPDQKSIQDHKLKLKARRRLRLLHPSLCLKHVRAPRHRTVLRRVRGTAETLMVQKRQMVFIRRGVQLTLPIICPPQLMSTKSSANLAKTLDAEPIDIQFLAQKSKVVCLVRECDSDGTNLKFLHEEATRLLKNVAQGNLVQKVSLCLSHQIHIAAGTAYLSCSAMLSGYFNGAHVTRTYFSSILSNVVAVVNKHLDVVIGPPPAKPNLGTLLHLMSVDPDDPATIWFCQLYNGNWEEDRIVHYTEDAHRTRRDIVREMSDACATQPLCLGFKAMNFDNPVK